jgi:8-oxo-dGTP pyrophosphatase MutT (NUDIX family)
MVLLPLIIATLLHSTTEEVRAGIILKKEDRYLLVQSKFTGKWSFTKGHTETHDINLLETAQREVKEEAGYLELEHYTIDSGPDFIGRTHYWYGTVTTEASPAMRLDEQSGIGWFTKKEIKSLKKNQDVKAWLSLDK